MAPEPPRSAPRALTAYLLAASASIPGAARSVADRSVVWREALSPQGLVLASRLRQHDPRAVEAAIAGAGIEQFSAAIAGIEAYRRAAPLRRPADPPVIWRAGAARLLDFGADETGMGDASRKAGGAPVALCLPSLVNRAVVLDLSRARSLMRGLSARGVRPMLLDWGEPGVEERGFGLADYITRRIGPALETARARADGRVALLGHCMGGTLALAAAQLFEAQVSRLALIAAPWDASDLLPPAGHRPGRAELERLIAACGAVFGGVPPDLLDLLFFARDPLQALRKFPEFAGLDRDSARGRLFVAVEDWLNDGVRLAAPAARELFIDWGLDNAPMRGRWRVGGVAIRPDRLRLPALVAASRKDTITPFESALAAGQTLPEADVIEPRAGHVGMIVGRHAEEDLWDPLAAWLRA